MSECIVYKCNSCKKHFILLTEEVTHSEQESRYITCPYHGSHRNISVAGKYEDIEKCMEHDSYKRVKGSIKQTKWSR